jgi:hypothetical protein
MNDKKCNYIPLIEKRGSFLLFLFEKNVKKYFCTEELLKMILNGELFIKKDIKIDSNNERGKEEINNKNTINIIDKLDNNNINNKSKIQTEINDIKTLKKKIRYIFKLAYQAIGLIYKKFNEYKGDYQKNNENIEKNIIMKKMIDIFKKADKIICSLIYYRIIKNLINEYFYLIKQNTISIYTASIRQNIFNAMKEIKYKRRKIWKKEETNQKFSIIWIIEFYSKEQIKNDINKNVFISISLGGYVIIYSLNISMDSNKKIEELFKVIKMKRV